MSLINSQNLVLADIFQTSNSPSVLTHSAEYQAGIKVYQNNLKANAERALAITYPSIKAIIGDENFQHATTQYLQEFLKSAADWGLWGEHLADYLAQQSLIESLPYLPDVARLDWAIHQAYRAKNSESNLNSFYLLEQDDSANLRFELASGLIVINSPFPIIAIRDHFKHEPMFDQDAFETSIEEAISQYQTSSGFNALVYRQGLTIQLDYISSAESYWYQLLLNNTLIGKALDSIEPHDFELSSWLPKAIQQQLVVGVV